MGDVVLIFLYYIECFQVSFGSKSPVLSDRKKFPLFFRTVTPDSSHNAARISFIKHFGWEAVATFSQSENAFLLPINRLITQLEKVNVTSSTPITFSLDNYREQLRILKVRLCRSKIPVKYINFRVQTRGSQSGAFLRKLLEKYFVR